MKTKRVILMRTDLSMGPGKMVAQAAHAALMSFTNRGSVVKAYADPRIDEWVLKVPCRYEDQLWLSKDMTEVCLQVGSEDELVSLYSKAKEAGITATMIEDAGLTLFRGTPTKTCCSIGPHFVDVIDSITGHLKLLD